MLSGKYEELAGGTPVGISNCFSLPCRPCLLGVLNKAMVMTK